MSRSSTIIDELLPNPHPGEILLEEFLKPMGISQSALARAIGVPPRRINEIVLGKRAVTADTDLRLARYFGLSEGFLLGAPGRLRADGGQAEARPGARRHPAAGGVDCPGSASTRHWWRRGWRRAARAPATRCGAAR